MSGSGVPLIATGDVFGRYAGVFLIPLVIKPDSLEGLALKIVTPVASTIVVLPKRHWRFRNGYTLIFSMRTPKEAFIYYHGILWFLTVQISAMIYWICRSGFSAG